MMASELGTSLYHRVFLVLRDQIDNGRYPPGSVLPSEQEVCREFGVSRVTSRRALAELAAAGVIYRQQGRGTFVREDIAATRRLGMTPAMTGQIGDFLEQCKSTLHEFEYLAAPETIREALGHEADAQGLYQRAVRIRKVEDRAVLQAITWVRESLGRHWTADDLTSTPVKQLVRRAGIELTGGTQVTTAVLCEPVVAERLDIMVGAPLLRVERRLFDAGGNVHVYVEMVARPDRFKLQMDLAADDV